MKFLILGGDRRQIETAHTLKSKGYDVYTFGLPTTEDYGSNNDLKEEISNSDAVILPLPVTRDGKTVNSPLSNEVIFLEDLIRSHPKKVFGGIINENWAKEFDAAGITYYDYFKSEALTVKNAVLTAEASISIAINGTDGAIFGSNALVIGYGRIGKKLAQNLKVLGATVTATSRNSGTLATIAADGFSPLETNNIRERVKEFDYIFNTAPYPIMDSAFFSDCKQSAFVLDLATDAGTDFAAAKRFGINAGLYSGLPGKHSPITAAYFITEEILSNI